MQHLALWKPSANKALSRLEHLPLAAGSDSSGGGGGVRINEIMPSNKNSVTDSRGGTPAWVELYNGGGSALNLGGGYTLSEQGDGGDGWAFPSGTTLSPGEYLLIFLSNRNSSGEGSSCPHLLG